MKNKLHIALLFILFSVSAVAQKGNISGNVTDTLNAVIPATEIVLKDTRYGTVSNTQGEYNLKNINYGTYTLVAFALGKEIYATQVEVNKPSVTVNIVLKPLKAELNEVTVHSEREKTFGISRLKSVDGVALYEAKKNELIVMNDVTANLSTNNARQIFAKVPGLNIWESDGAGLQLGIGGRGLSPNRTSNFNTRQNGYDISADALGYPESYYTPPSEALERIEVVRGASSLQYGTQFGGMLNFVMKRGPQDKKIEINSRQTLGSWGLWNSFNSAGGTVLNKKLNYYTFFQHKQGNGWRPNSQFEVNTAFASVQYKASKKLTVGVDYTYMHYLAQQPGGLTDVQFERDPTQSVRSRNWFTVDWNLFALTFDYVINEHTKINVRNFGLIASRKALGNLERINVLDLGGNRTMVDGSYHNMGNETRLLHHYRTGKKSHTVVTGFRLYKGTTTARQGDASKGSGANFSFNNPDNLENSDFRFPNTNIAVFAENIFRFSQRLSLTPGIRYEYINTKSAGYYRFILRDLAGNIVVDQKNYDEQNLSRGFLIGGLGLSYKINLKHELYANFSQNYRAVNFSDLRITNPNMKVDSNMQDEKGFSADIGIRGNKENWFNYDVSLFILSYQNRIGLLLKADQPPLYLDYRYRTNVADAITTGIESFAEVNVLKLFKSEAKSALLLFSNVAIIQSLYINSNDNSINNKKVELVPPVSVRAGSTFRNKKFQATAQFSYVGEQYSDATNAIRSSSAVNGIVPAYFVADFSMRYTWKRLTFETGCNNIANNYYFTRRADGYPGPGIIPADGRSFYFTLGGRF